MLGYPSKCRLSTGKGGVEWLGLPTRVAQQPRHSWPWGLLWRRCRGRTPPATSFGVVVDSTLSGQSASGCLVGAGCSAGTIQPVPFNGSGSQTFRFTVSSSNGDNYQL